MCKYSSADRSALLAHEAGCPARASYVEMLRKDGLRLEDVTVFGNVIRGGRQHHPGPNHMPTDRDISVKTAFY